MKNIVVLGCGLVGRVMAEDLSQNHNVTSVDISQDNLDKIRSKKVDKIFCQLSHLVDLVVPKNGLRNYVNIDSPCHNQDFASKQ